MFCLNCGKEIPDNSAVCQFCGVAQPQAQQVPPQAPQEAPQQAPYGAPQQAPFNAPQQAPYGAAQQAPYGAPQQPPFGAPQQPFPSFAPPTPTKNKAPMIIGIVVGAIVLLAIIIGIAGSSGDDSTYDGYAPVETFGEYDVDIETIPEDAVEAADIHVLTQTTAEGLTNTLTYYCDGDIVKSWTQVSSASIVNVDEATLESAITDVEEKFDEYDFIEYSYEIDNDIFTETFVINDASEHIDELVELDLVDQSLFGATEISYSRSKTNLLAQGFTEVE